VLDRNGNVYDGVEGPKKALFNNNIKIN